MLAELKVAAHLAKAWLGEARQHTLGQMHFEAVVSVKTALEPMIATLHAA